MILFGEKITPREVLGALIAVGGVALLFYLIVLFSRVSTQKQSQLPGFASDFGQELGFLIRFPCVVAVVLLGHQTGDLYHHLIGDLLADL